MSYWNINNGNPENFPSGINYGQVIRRATRSIANQANDSLFSGGSNAANRKNSSINQLGSSYTSSYKTSVNNGDWHEYSGIFNPSLSNSNIGIWDQSLRFDMSDEVIVSGVDRAANPTDVEPGRLVLQDGSAKPKQLSYPGVIVKNPPTPRINLLTAPSDFSNAAWIKTNVTVDGDAIYETAVSASFQMRQNINVVNGNTYEWSIEAKSVGTINLGIYFAGASWDTAGVRWLDLNTGGKQTVIDNNFIVVRLYDNWFRMTRLSQATSDGVGQFYLIFGLGNLSAPDTIYAGNPADGVRVRNAYVYNNGV